MYLGNKPVTDQTYLSLKSQQITGTGVATYSLDYDVSSPEDLAVFINEVRQNVNTYTIDNQQITLGGNVTSSDTCYIVYLSRAVGSIAPQNNSVGSSKIIDGAVTTAKIADDAVSSAKMFSGFSNGITQADQWRLNADFSMSTTGSNVLVNSNWERVDEDGFGKIGTGMTESSGVFSFPSTGIYFIQSIADILNNSGSADGNAAGLRIFTTTTGDSTYSLAAGGYQAAANNEYVSLTANFVFDVTDITTHKVGFYYRVNQSSVLRGHSSLNESCVTFIRLGDT